MPTSDNNSNFDVISVKHELQNLIQGNGGQGQENLIQTTARYLRGGKEPSASSQKMEFSKE